MFGMTTWSSQAKTLVEFINAEKANYIEEKVKGIPNQKNAMKIYKEIHADPMTSNTMPMTSFSMPDVIVAQCQPQMLTHCLIIRTVILEIHGNRLLKNV